MESRQDRRFCSACGFENAADAVHCAQCGDALGSVTTMATPLGTSLDALQALTQPADLSASEVLFLIAGQQDPVTITMSYETRQILIGRSVGGEQPPDLDLAAFSDVATSISRRHVLLDFSEDRATATDLGSTNGSWLNENRLAAHMPRVLHNGDLLRVGQQFMFVYFASKLDATQIIALTDPQGIAAHLTPDTWGMIGQYFEALAIIQDVCSELQGQAQKTITISEMKVNRSQQLVKARLAHAAEALQLVARVVPPWREQYPPALNKAIFPDRAWHELERLTLETLAQLFPDMVEQERAAAAQRLFASLCLIAAHTFELSTIERWD